MSAPIDFDTYQRATADTAIYPGAGTGSMQALAYIGLGLGEAGEIQGKIKKILRDNQGVISTEARNEILKEAGDLQWYLARLAAELKTPLGRVAEVNLEKLASRKDRGTLSGSGDNR